MTKAISQNIQSILRYREAILFTLIFSIIISACAYGFLIEKAIMNVVGREDLIKKSRMISASLVPLEEKYFSIKNNINIDLAHAKGFRDADPSIFITSKSLTAMASHNEF